MIIPPPSDCDHQNNDDALDVTICSSATKVGRILGFVNATVYDTKSGQPICYNSQIKYLPAAKKIVIRKRTTKTMMMNHC